MNVSNITFSNVSFDWYCKPDKPDGNLEKNAKEIVLVFVVVLGILSNIFIVILAVKYTVRKNLHYLIVNMAVSDALFLFNRLWSEVSFKYRYELMYPDGVMGDVLCKTITFAQEICYPVSLLTLLVISIERFRATRRTLQRQRPNTLKQRVAILGICWLIPIIPAGYWCYGIEFDEVAKVCTVSLQTEKLLIYPTVILLTMTSVIIVILSLSIITVRRLSKPQPIQAHLTEEQLAMRRKRTRSAVFMVMSSTLLYACCWLPINIFAAYAFLSLHFPNIFSFRICYGRDLIIFITNNFLPAVNSCFSPFIYIIFLPDFRGAAKRVLCRCKKETNQINPPEEIQLAENR